MRRRSLTVGDMDRCVSFGNYINFGQNSGKSLIFSVLLGMEKLVTNKELVNSLLDELLVLIEEYSKATDEDAPLSVKKEIRLRMREIQQKVQEIRSRETEQI